MKIYLAGTAPGNEFDKEKKTHRKMQKRLLSYYFIETNMMENQNVFKALCKDKGIEK